MTSVAAAPITTTTESIAWVSDHSMRRFRRWSHRSHNRTPARAIR